MFRPGWWHSNPAPPAPSRKPPIQNSGQLRGCSGVVWATRRGTTLAWLPRLPCWVKLQTGLCPGACPPTPTRLSFMLVGKGIMLVISLVLHSLNKLYAPERCIILCFAFSLVREVCCHVVLGVNDLRISTIIPKSNNCCTAGQTCRKSVLSPCTDIT